MIRRTFFFIHLLLTYIVFKYSFTFDSQASTSMATNRLGPIIMGLMRIDSIFYNSYLTILTKYWQTLNKRIQCGQVFQHQQSVYTRILTHRYHPKLSHWSMVLFIYRYLCYVYYYSVILLLITQVFCDVSLNE